MQVRYGRECDRLMRVLNALAMGENEKIFGAKNDEVEVFDDAGNLYVSFLIDIGSEIHVCVLDYKDFTRKCKQARKILIYLLTHADENGVCEFHAYNMVQDGLASRESSGIRMIRNSMKLLRNIQITTDSEVKDFDLIKDNISIVSGRIRIELNPAIIATNVLTLPNKCWKLSPSAFATMLYLLYIKGRSDGGRHRDHREIKALKLIEYLYIDPKKQKQRAEAKRFCERIINELKEVGLPVEMDQVRSMDKWMEYGKIRIKKKGR